jgi:GDP/UDP-N,N'-diacetylbacillosamine 2-epimerase (hydrolysing)
MRKICVVTGSRAEYGLLYWLMKAINDDVELDLQLIATGMHLSPEFGLTWRQIEDDGFMIRQKVEMLLSSDTAVGISKSMGLGLIGFADALNQLQPDLLVVLGDRFEIFVAVQAAMNHAIPIAHIHGGELSEGVIDDSIRHAISKMAHIHFTATEIYRRRVIQLGEQPDKVFCVGAPGLDNIYNLALLDRRQLEESLKFNLGKRNILVTFHPVTWEQISAAEQFRQLLLAFDSFTDMHIIFTHANADADGRMINYMIEDYRKQHPDRVAGFVSMGTLRYLSAMSHVDAVVGNSSSGILEAPALKVATINIGDRQRGRVFADSVLHCVPEAEDIRDKLQFVFSGKMNECLQSLDNPYGVGGASLKIKEIIKQFSLQGLQKKHFYDLNSI